MTQYRDLPKLLPDPLKRVQHKLVMAKLILAIQSLEERPFTVHDVVPLVGIGNRWLISRYLSFLCKEGYLSLYGKTNSNKLSIYSRKERIFSIFSREGKSQCHMT